MSRPIIMQAGLKGLVPSGTLRPSGGSEPAADPAEILRQETAKARRAAIEETEARLRAEFARERAQDQKWRAAFDQRFEELLRSMEKQIADQLINMSIRVAEVILRQKMPDRAMLDGVIRETLAPISDLQGVRVRMHPADAARMIASRGEDPDAPGVCDRVEIVADPSLAAGDVMIESRNGYFDARIHERMTLLEERLKQRYRNQHAGDTGH